MNKKGGSNPAFFIHDSLSGTLSLLPVFLKLFVEYIVF